MNKLHFYKGTGIEKGTKSTRAAPMMKSKHHLNLKGKALAKARMKYNEHNKNLEDQEYNRNH